MKSQPAYGIVHMSNLLLKGDGFHRENLSIGWKDILPTDIGKSLYDVRRECRFIVVSGDITFSGSKEEFYCALSFIKEIINYCEVPPKNIILVPGNHDRNWSVKEDFELENFENWCKKIGCELGNNKDKVLLFKECNIAFVLLDSTQGKKKSSGRISEYQLATIRKNLSSITLNDTVIYAVLHHGLDRRLVGEHVVDNPDILYSFIDEWGVDVLLHSSGHLANLNWSAYETKYGKVVSVAGGTLTEEKWRASIQTTGYQIIKGYNDRSISLVPRIYKLSEKKMYQDFNGESKILLDKRSGVRPNPSPISKIGKAKLSKKNLNYLHTRLNRLAQNDLEDLVYNSLKAEIDTHNPILECRNDFTNRLVNYFSEEKSLDTLLEEVRKCYAEDNYKDSSIFISSSEKDIEYAKELSAALERHGYKIWNHFNNLKPGDNISESIAKGLRYSDVLLVLLSDSAINSKWVRKEVEWGLTNNNINRTHIILVLLSDCEIPEILNNYPLVRINKNQKLDKNTINSIENILIEYFNRN